MRTRLPRATAATATAACRGRCPTGSSSSRSGYSSPSARFSKEANGNGGNALPPPLPLSPAKAKQEYLRAQAKDPVQRMAQLQKELDIVRDRAAERLEQQLQKSAWRRLTDPLRRHAHSWINVGAVLLSYILAHNLYQRAKEVRHLQSELDETTSQRDVYQGALRELLSAGTLQQLAAECTKELTGKENQPSTRNGFWWWSRPPLLSSSSSTTISAETMLSIQSTLQYELQARIGHHTLTDEERRIQELQKAWNESQQQVVESPELDLLQSVLQQEGEGDGEHGPQGTKKQRRVISM